MTNKKPISVALVGGTGYTGQELLRLLASHPNVQVAAVCSRSDAGVRIDERFPIFRGVYDLTFSDIDMDIFTAVDLVLFATPNAVAMHYARDLLAAGIRLIDLSADFRIDDAALWQQWYGQEHACPELLDESVYGLPELVSNKDISEANIVANPGCYATAMQLALAPVMQLDDQVAEQTFIVDGKSGVSGAGKSAVESSLLAQAGENFSAYKVSGHRHQPETAQQLAKLRGNKAAVNLVFVPHLVPMVRGILTTCYVSCRDTTFDYNKHYSDYYQNRPFVDVLPEHQSLETKSVSGTNLCRISPRIQGDTLVVIALIDNLIKGAAGQAIQNLNHMFALPETTGLTHIAQYP